MIYGFLMAKVLVIEDDAAVSEALTDWLEAEGHRAEAAYDGLEGLELLKFGGFDLAIVDWQLPTLEGTEICARFRQAGGRTPILMLTQKSATIEKAQGLDAGADDYLPKPFDSIELGARVRALLRRSAALFEKSSTSGKIAINQGASTVTVEGREIKLLKREFELLEFLLRHPGTYFSVDQLIKHVWDSSADVSNEALRTCMSRLRTKVDLPDKPSIIDTAKGWGYKISDHYLN
jgi:DNA-binding response OmpR family regulator